MSLIADTCPERDTNEFLSLSFTKGVGNSKVEWMDGCVDADFTTRMTVPFPRF